MYKSFNEIAEFRLNVLKSHLAAKKMPQHADPLSSHILDTSSGQPAKGVPITFEMYNSTLNQWTEIQKKVTNEDGRASGFLSWQEFHPATYRLRFDVKHYFSNLNLDTFYPYAEVVFEIKDDKRHYHIPLLLSPYGYTTYRGS